MAPSMLKQMFTGDPDELKLSPDTTLQVVAIHGLDDNLEAMVHRPNAHWNGVWIDLYCGTDKYGQCPYCQDPRNELSRTTVKSIMIVFVPSLGAIKFYKLPISVGRKLAAWEQAAGVPLTKRNIVIQRTGSGFTGTRYDASVLDEAQNLPDWPSIEPEYNRIAAKVAQLLTPPPLDEMKAIYASGRIRLRGEGNQQQAQQPAPTQSQQWAPQQTQTGFPGQPPTQPAQPQPGIINPEQPAPAPPMQQGWGGTPQPQPPVQPGPPQHPVVNEEQW